MASVAPRREKAASLHHPQVLRAYRIRDLTTLGKLADGIGVAQEKLKNLKSMRVGKHAETFGGLP